MPEGVEVESKGLSLTLHFRRHPELAEAAREWATTMARDAGLEVRPAKMSLELAPTRWPSTRAPSSSPSSATWRWRATSVTTRGTSPPSTASTAWPSAGCTTLRVAVAAAESSPELLARADAQVAGPEGVLAFLRSLLEDQRRGTSGARGGP